MGRERGEDQQTSDHLLERCPDAVSWSASGVEMVATRRRHGGVCLWRGRSQLFLSSGDVRVILARLVLHRDRSDISRPSA